MPGVSMRREPPAGRRARGVRSCGGAAVVRANGRGLEAFLAEEAVDEGRFPAPEDPRSAAVLPLSRNLLRVPRFEPSRALRATTGLPNAMVFTSATTAGKSTLRSLLFKTMTGKAPLSQAAVK